MAKHHVVHLGLFIAYILAMTALMIWQGIGITPDRYIFGLIFLAFLIRRTRDFFIHWAPFLFILLSYDYLRGLADFFNPRVNYLPQIQADLILFGQLPTITLQQWLYQPGILQWYDYLFTISYFLHFALPLAFGFLLWLVSRNHFKQFTTALLILSYSAFLTYLIFPAAPPWLASQRDIIPETTKILDLALRSFPERLHLPTLYHNFDPNQVAAIPSLHAAYPFLVLLFCWRFFKLKGWYFLPYVLLVWFSIVYMAEHYVVDIIIGAFYALISYLLSVRLLHKD